MMQAKRSLVVLSLAAIVGLASLACGNAPAVVPRNAVAIEVRANTGLTPWLSSAVEAFNKAGVKTSGGRPAFVNLVTVESGQAVIDMSAGAPTPALWIPDNEVWVHVLADRGQNGFQADCASIAQSPLVIALWQPIAESLGWPGRSLGWLDIGSLAADEPAWAYYSGGQFGTALRIGHTHPGLSATGANTLLALVQAAQSKSEAVTASEIQLPIVRASVGTFEGAVTWFSSSTEQLGQTMRERGISYLGAAVVYESTVVNYGSGDPALVAIYPFEGTFMATHPACVNGNGSPEAQEAARLFRDYLLKKEAQQSAMANGLRPVSAEVTLGAPLDDAHGVDLAQPEVIFAQPSVETLYAAQTMWQAARKDVHLVMLLDTSGSMMGDKIKAVQQSAIQFVEQMGDDDAITIITFANQATILVSNQQVGPNRAGIIRSLRSMQAVGKTAMYDAIGEGARLINEAHSSQRSNVMVVLTDGNDNSSTQYRFNQQLVAAATAHDTTVFTIAYGSDAERKNLTDLASRANGNFYLGTEANIAEIYQEMSAGFGGSAGIGR